MILPGISTACFYPAPTEDALALVSAAGARSTEIFVNAPMEFTDAFLGPLCRLAQQNDIHIVSIHPFSSGFEPLLLFSTYHRRTQDGFALYQRYFALCARYGVPYFIMHGAARYTSSSDTFLIERFGELATLAHAEGVTLLQENVSRCKSGDPAYILKMREQLGALALFTLDTKQALRMEHTAEELRAAMGSGLRHIHLSDFGDAGDCLPPGKGRFDLSAFFEALRKQGYSGAVVLELYRESYDRPEDLFESYRYFSALLEEPA